MVAGLLAGLGEADPDLAVAVDCPALYEVCAELSQLMWTPLMLQRWGGHPRWVGVPAEAVLGALRGLGLPPEAPRSAVPARQDVCPEHQVLMRAGTCDACVGAKTAGPPPAWRRRGDTLPGGIELPFLAEGAAP